MNRNANIVFVFALFLKYFNISAQESKMKFGMYLDTYYSYDFSRPANYQRAYVTQYDRHNEFNVNHLWISGAWDSEYLRVSLALQTGSYVRTNYAAETQLAQLIYEAYAGIRLGTAGWLDAGVFAGHFGYESALSFNRELLSPALVTEYTPYYQSGVKLTQPLSSRTELRAVVLNGWQNIGETNDHKSVGIAFDHQLTEKLEINYGNYFGNESTLPGENWRRQHHNLLAQWQSTTWLWTGVADFTFQNTDGNRERTLFLTLIGQYQWNDKWKAAARYEWVSDEQQLLIGTLYGFTSANVLSICMSHQPHPYTRIKLEPKWYASKDPIFPSATSLAQQNWVLALSMAALIK